jgi:group I intron endonuclease
MSKALSGENNPRGMLGKFHLEETKALMSEALSGENNPMFGKTHSTETKVKMSEAKIKKVFVYSKDSVSNELILFKSFNSCDEATKFFDCSKSSIYNYLDKNKLFRKQWILSTSER